ncbi:hypothetical protein [Sinorhizobium sp. BG8]|uniref:hypothetical protein n=1 Tax=Sinorhizobium sp. BG8 TaxID=2613773 RepID=UPI00193E0B83|nr:hypothetical protein [Sinorhizobium sp. BG8]QRM54999.1 hypothetical protein F3Y30_10920 [Sinorhizobium sp. BG8]
MSKQSHREPKGIRRGSLPIGFLAFLLTLLVTPFALLDDGCGTRAGESQNMEGKPSCATPESARSGDLPRPLSTAGGMGRSELWIPGGATAERRSSKSKAGVSDGDGAAKAALSRYQPLVYAFEVSSDVQAFHRDDAHVTSAAAAAFRSRAPPRAAS